MHISGGPGPVMSALRPGLAEEGVVLSGLVRAVTQPVRRVAKTQHSSMNNIRYRILANSRV